MEISNSGISRSWYYRLSKVFAACANPTIEILRQKFPAPSRQDVKFEIWSSDLRAFVRDISILDRSSGALGSRRLRDGLFLQR
jgi:hypothetical protein